MMQATQHYIETLKKIDFLQASELSLRTAFENYINEFIVEAKIPPCKVLHEGKRIGSFGVPDFRIYQNASILGYIEAKNTNENLDKTIKSEQIGKYRELSQNLLITNYIDFIWIKGETIHRQNLCYLSDIEDKNFKLDSEKVEKVEKLLLNFFCQVPQKISLPKDLALALAVRCKNLKDFIHQELTRQNQQNQQERLQDLYQAFKENIFSELTIAEFSDAFAQMLVYGLFLAGLNADTKAISLENVKKYIPASFQLIRELVSFLDELEKPEYKETKWIIDESIAIVNNIEWADFMENMRFDKKVKDSEDIETDPYIYFYETFLATYDYHLRKAKGVYYTPPQVVSFIVGAIHEVLKHEFGLSQGLAERNKVTLLDFATGTGTFLLEVFKIILENTPSESYEKRRIIIQEHILKNLFGFEYLIAPYTVAHLKLSQFLKENGYEFGEKDRLQVYLTNTLEPVDKQVRVPFMPQLSKEAQAAQKVKDTPILVIVGNPPYSGHSKNKSDWIKQEIKKYNFVDGKPLGEKNSKWLQDDYVKFIRFAQDKMDKSEQGIVGIITNHSFLDNPTFRGMRQSLMNTFDQLYFIDLHGNTKKKEKTPEGEKDQNIFDIEQGVCISVLIKKKGLKKGVFHTDVWGDRQTKFKLCLNNSLKSLIFNELTPNSPFYLFVPQNQATRAVYERFWSVKDIFEVNGTGIVTKRDNLAIHFDLKDALQAARDIIKLEKKEFYHKYQLPKDVRDWRYEWAKKDIEEYGIKESLIKKIHYRPFDVRSIVYTGKSRGFIGWPVVHVMQHFEKENIGLITIRHSRSQGEWNFVFVSDKMIAGATAVTSLDINYLFPLYRYNGNGDSNGSKYLFKEEGKKDNFTQEFRNFIKTYYQAKPTDKNQIAKLEATIQVLENQIKQIQNIILRLQKLDADSAIIDIQKQFLEKINTIIEQKREELHLAHHSQEANYEPSTEEIFYYMYAILHSPTFRKKYAELLKMDFPRIPFTPDLNIFQKLSHLGEELAQKHLLKQVPKDIAYKELGVYKGKGDNIVLTSDFRVEKTENQTQYKLYINPTQYFETVPEDVYNFHIGGYQVLDKYLKDRKNRQLTLDEIENIENIIKVLAFTIRQMEIIDSQTKEWI